MTRIVALAAILMLSACASVTKGTEQVVQVETPGVAGASCKLKDTKFREWTVESTPGSALVQKGDGPMDVVCKKTGYHPGTLIVPESFEAMTIGNVLIGGVVGIAIDAASGAAQKYPDLIKVQMNPLSESEARAAAAREAEDKTPPPPTQVAATPVVTETGRRQPRKGFQRLKNEEIRLLFRDTRINDYPDDWAISFGADGKWEGTWAGPRTVYGYGTWAARNGLHCLTILDHDGFSYESPDEGRCFQVWVDEEKGKIRLDDPHRPSDRQIIKENAFAEIDRLLITSR